MYDELIKRLRECTAEQNGEKTLWHQAADAIEDLQQITTHYEEESKGWWLAACDAKEERERLKEQIPKWIPVTERLPEDGEFVLVCNDDGIIMVAKHETDLLGWYKRYCPYDYDWWWENEDGRITHWMPLPSTEGLNET